MTEPTDWMAYRKCPICRRVCGEPCYSTSSRIIDGQPDGVRTDLEVPHVARRLRVGPKALKVA